MARLVNSLLIGGVVELGLVVGRQFVFQLKQFMETQVVRVNFMASFSFSDGFFYQP